jgi:hypothetical protein
MIPEMAVTFNRAEFLRLLSASAAWVAAGSGGRVLARQSNVAPSESRIAGIIAEYDRQGIHRTATAVDDASADWLLAQVQSMGATASAETFALNRLDVRMAHVSTGNDQFEGLPLFDGGATDGDGESGTLGIPSANTGIALTRLSAADIRTEGRSLERLRRSGSHRAIVAITVGDHPGLSPSNAFSFASPYGPPVLQVSSEHREFLERAARSGAQARVLVLRSSTRATPRNVIGIVNGQQPDLSPIVVMTPRSGWWQCAGERGGGIACWLEMARAVAVARVRRSFLFVASSGHELGHAGLESFLSSRPALVKSAAAWIHIGANIGAAGGTVRLQSSDTAIEAMADATMAEVGAGALAHVPIGSVPGGEARNIHVGGGRYVSLLGSGPYFHSQSDRWPSAVDVPAVARFASALQALAIKLGNQA